MGGKKKLNSGGIIMFVVAMIGILKRNAMIYNSLPFIDQISTTLKIPLRQPLVKATKNNKERHD